MAVGLCSLRFAEGVRRQRGAKEEGEQDCAITIIICVADADAEMLTRNIPLFYSILGEKGEIKDRLIVVADHVSEVSLGALRKAAEACGPNIRIKDNKGGRGKKHAQRLGVENAETDVIVSVDADCVVGRDFLDIARREAAQCRGRDFMLLLPVEMLGDGTLFGQMEEMEFGCLQVVTAGTALMGRPTMANGAGMAFNKGLYMEHDAQTRYASGDDMFLLAHAIRKGAEVRYVADERAVITTSAPASVGAYLRQRTRWLAKAGGYRSAGVVALALVVFAAVMAWPVGVVYALMGGCSWSLAAGVFVAKLLVDGLACGAWLWFREESRGLRRLWVAVPMEVAYPVMTAVVAARAAAAPRGRW